MTWEKIYHFLTTEAIAAYIVALIPLIILIYREVKARRGRHIVCTQTEPVFSHISLSEAAKKWIRVAYFGDAEDSPVEIGTLSQTIIDVKNNSDTDALNDIELSFRLPETRVVRLWWEEIPDYLRPESKLDHLVEGPTPDEKEPSPKSETVVVSLPQVKSHKKYKESIKFGILADGDLNTLEMLERGSKSQVPNDQVWTAQFVSHKQQERKRAARKSMGSIALGMLIMLLTTIALSEMAFPGIIETMLQNLVP